MKHKISLTAIASLILASSLSLLAQTNIDQPIVSIDDSLNALVSINVNVPSVADAEDREYTVSPISLSPSTVQGCTVSVNHTVIHSSSYYSFQQFISYENGWPYTRQKDLLNFTFTNKDEVIGGPVLGIRLFDATHPFFDVKKLGGVTLDFSYTKTTPAYYVDGLFTPNKGQHFALIPEKKATTTIHVPIKIVDDINTENDLTAEPIYAPIYAVTNNTVVIAGGLINSNATPNIPSELTGNQ